MIKIIKRWYYRKKLCKHLKLSGSVSNLALLYLAKDAVYFRQDIIAGELMKKWKEQ